MIIAVTATSTTSATRTSSQLALLTLLPLPLPLLLLLPLLRNRTDSFSLSAAGSARALATACVGMRSTGEARPRARSMDTCLLPPPTTLDPPWWNIDQDFPHDQPHKPFSIVAALQHENRRPVLEMAELQRENSRLRFELRALVVEPPVPHAADLPNESELSILYRKLDETEAWVTANLDEAETAVLELEAAGKPTVFCNRVASAMFDARLYLMMSGSGAGHAVKAEFRIAPLLGMVPEGALKHALREAMKWLRDVIALRVQLRVPIDSRAAFLEMLRGAYGGQVAPVAVAKILHSHRRLINPLFEHSFLSNNQKVNATRHKPRPARKRDIRRREERKRWEELAASFADTDHAASLTDAEHAASLTDAEHAASLTDAEV